ncbi:MAG: alpha/beta fold hydrolase [Legionella sp.]
MKNLLRYRLRENYTFDISYFAVGLPLELNHFSILGNSLGGHVGLLYCINHPERVKTLILTGSSGLYENAVTTAFLHRKNYHFVKAKVEQVFYERKIATKELVDDIFETVNDRKRSIKILAMAKSALKHNMDNELSVIHIPVALIWGRNDAVTPPKVAIEFRKLLPNSELHWIEYCGHAPMMEQPEEFNSLLRHFLEKHK